MPVDQVTALDALRPDVTNEPLHESGEHFVDGCYSDLTQCHHGDIGRFRNKADGKAVALLWNWWLDGGLQALRADRDRWFEASRAHHVASMKEAQRADQAEVRAILAAPERAADRAPSLQREPDTPPSWPDAAAEGTPLPAIDETTGTLIRKDGE
ncbi:hypothetical protein LCM17_18450 [Cereibacter sphaeroides]|nr:hypothetical protein [Cereibacter sphaeroides]